MSTPIRLQEENVPLGLKYHHVDVFSSKPLSGQQISGEQQTVTEIGQVRVDAQFPGIAERADHFEFLRQILIFPIFHFALVRRRKLGDPLEGPPDFRGGDGVF